MAGLKNDVLFGLNGDFSQSDNTSPSESNGLITDGQLWIGSTALNGGSTHISVGEITSPDNSITLGYSSPNITAQVNRNVVQDLHTARFIVSSGGSTDGANFTTIQAAINSAQGTGINQTVFIQPGTYAENLTLRPGINLVAYDCDGQTPNVTILGTCTFTEAGTVSISGIRLQTNGSFALAVTGTLASIVNLVNCYIAATNNTAISHTVANASSLIYMQGCNGDISANGITLIASSSTGNVRMFSSLILNSGNSTTSSTFSAGGFFPNQCSFNVPFTISGTTGTIAAVLCSINTGAINTTSITYNSTIASAGSFYEGVLSSGTAAAISVGAGAAFLLSNSNVESTNANAITGAGTISYTSIDFAAASSTINTTTQTPLVTRYAIARSTLQPAFLAYLSATTANNTTGDGTSYTPISDTEVFDQNSNYNNATGVFTAPVTGRYQFNAGFRCGNLGAAHTSGQAWITTSNRVYTSPVANFAAARDSSDLFGLTLSCLADMEAGDTASLTITVSNSTKTVNLQGSATNPTTFFSGNLVC